MILLKHPQTVHYIKKKRYKKVNFPKALAANPRQVAFQVLSAVYDGQNPEESLETLGLLLSPKDFSLSTALVYEVLRHQTYLDWLMSQKLHSGRASRALTIILRLGLAQILFFDRLGDHAIVMETVNLAKGTIPGRQGVANAILRSFLRDKDAGGFWPPKPPKSKQRAKDLAILYSHPQWLVEKMITRFGLDKTEEILKANNQPTPPTLRLNPLKIKREDFLAQTNLKGQPTTLSPWGLLLDNFSGRPETWLGYQEGLFSLQDEASQLLGLLAEEFNGKKILDACAGLGGKSLGLATLLPQSQILALDKDGAKLQSLQKEAKRLGVTNVSTKAVDFFDFNSAEKFDLVLLDAPCTGLGVIRRRPDLKWNKKQSDPARLAALQGQLLAKAASFLQKDGRLIYSVCTITEEEGPQLIQNFVEKFPFKCLDKEKWPDILKPLLSPSNHLTLTPPQYDGFFWAMLIGQ